MTAWDARTRVGRPSSHRGLVPRFAGRGATSRTGHGGRASGFRFSVEALDVEEVSGPAEMRAPGPVVAPYYAE